MRGDSQLGKEELAASFSGAHESIDTWEDPWQLRPRAMPRAARRTPPAARKVGHPIGTGSATSFSRVRPRAMHSPSPP